MIKDIQLSLNDEIQQKNTIKDKYMNSKNDFDDIATSLENQLRNIYEQGVDNAVLNQLDELNKEKKDLIRENHLLKEQLDKLINENAMNKEKQNKIVEIE